MIKHIVMWKLKEIAQDRSRQENAQRVKELLESCSAIVPGIMKFEVALARVGFEATYDVVLYAEFASRAALDAYNNHPTHLAIKPIISALREERQCMDYEI